MTPERALLLFLADAVEGLIIANHDPHERELRRELDRLRKPLLDAARDEANVRRLIGMPEPCCGNAQNCPRAQR